MSDATLMVGDSESNANLFYATHFLAGDPFIYLTTGDRSVLVVGDMEHGRACKESSVQDVRTFNDFDYRELMRKTDDRDRAFAQLVRNVADHMNVEHVCVESHFPVLLADELRAGGLALTVDTSLLAQQRRQKSPAEIAAIEVAQRATERAMAVAIDLIAGSEIMHGILHVGGIPLTSERLHTEVEIALVRSGMDTSLAPIIAGGPRAADPHFLGAGPLKAGEAIVLDIFPRSRQSRYFADMTRTVVKGSPNEPLQAMYDATSRALDAALAEIRAGANGRDVHRAAEAVFSNAGFAGEGTGPRFIHSTGHGVGLDIHEGPPLGSVDVELLEGDVVTVEPGLYDSQVGGIRLEDLVVVTAGGYRNLTDFPRTFQV